MQGGAFALVVLSLGRGTKKERAGVHRVRRPSGCLPPRTQGGLGPGGAGRAPASSPEAGAALAAAPPAPTTAAEPAPSGAASAEPKKVVPGGDLTACCAAIAAAAKKPGPTQNHYVAASAVCGGLAKAVKTGKANFASAKVTLRAQLAGVPVPSGC